MIRHLALGVVALAFIAIASSCADDELVQQQPVELDGGAVDASLPSDADTANDTSAPPLTDSAVPLPQFGACKPPTPTGMAFVLEPALYDLKFEQPVELVQGPGQRFYVVEQRGVIKVIPPVNGPPTVALDLTDIVFLGGETGLLGFAFDPNFAQNGFGYVYFTANIPSGFLKMVVRRYTSKDAGLTFDRSTEKTLMLIGGGMGTHNGGHLAFGPDGMLYIGIGDGGGSGDPLGNGQNKDVLFGKILRIDPNGTNPTLDGGNAYGIPASNPFATSGGRQEVYAYGLRNPWKFSFDKLTGDLWCGDVGQAGAEEINRIVLGGNYGWSIREGKQCVSTPTCSSVGMIDPVVDYPHTEGVSITGGYVYRGTKLPELKGKFIYGDFGVGNIWSVGVGDSVGTLLMRSNVNISTFGQDSSGEIYVADYATGGIKQLVASNSVLVATPGSTLSETGCLDPKNPKQAPTSAIAYTVNSPLWADHSAAKDRWVFVHEGSKIGVKPDGDFDLPPASVAVKTFSVGGKKIETRLFVRYGDGQWAGYSYEWADDESDAVLIGNSKKKSIGGFGPWYFPSPTDCFRCHTPAAGFTLGLEARQLNREATTTSITSDGGGSSDAGDAGLDAGDAGASGNILDRFANVLDTPIAKAAFPPLGAVDTPAISAEERARGYLHANCSFCHRAGNGAGAAMFDLLVDRTFLETKTCNVSPGAGDLAVVGSKIIVPGDSNKSILTLRMRALDTNRMPPLATERVDEPGTAAVESWISGLTSCP